MFLDPITRSSSKRHAQLATIALLFSESSLAAEFPRRETP